jgi:hypothetical protein
VLHEVFRTGLDDAGRFPPADRAVLETTEAEHGRNEAEGAGAIDGGDVGAQLNSALASIAAIQRLGCPPP